MRHYGRGWAMIVLMGSLSIGVFWAVLRQEPPRQSHPAITLNLGTDHVPLPAFLFRCSDSPPAGLVVACAASLDTGTLEVTVQGSSRELRGCTATYARRERPCSVTFDYGLAPVRITIADDLGLRTDQIARLRNQQTVREYTDTKWMRITGAITVALSLGGLGIFRKCVGPRTPRAWVAVYSNTLVFGLIQFVAFQISLLFLGFTD